MSLAGRLTRVRDEISVAAERAGRNAEDVALVAVSKGFGPDAIEQALGAGLRDFGENRVAEALEKKDALASEDIRWHFVGRLQRNKVKQVVGWVHLIHSVDRSELAHEISRRASQPAEVLLEVNTSGESSKGGVDPQNLDRLVEECLSLPGLRVAGLMTMAPISSDPGEVRPCFRLLASLAARLQSAHPDAGIHHLSMGMSQDYVVAVEEGATVVRVGEAIFGPRPEPGPRSFSDVGLQR